MEINFKYLTFFLFMPYNHRMKKIIVLIITVLFLSSCSYLPFTKKKEEAAKTSQNKPVQRKVTDIEEAKEPKPGDIKVVDGVEYIYARNLKWFQTASEPENVWIRKDQYSPGIIQSMLSDALGPSKKERAAMEDRIVKLEQELKKRNLAPQMGFPVQTGSLPLGMGYMPGVTPITFEYPSPRMKRRVLVLPADDRTNYKSEQLGELATRRLITRLESTGVIICVDPASTNIQGSFTDPANIKILSEVFGVQAILKGALSDVYTTTTRIEGKDANEASFAMSKLSIEVYNTDTGLMLKQLAGRNPLSLSREKGELSPEKAKIKAIDLAIEMIADELLRVVLFLDWHARIASIDAEKVYINAGRLSGLEKGRVLEVYTEGEKIIDSKTKAPLGTTKGKYKGELEVVELFGVDASWTKSKKGDSFSPTDIVYVKQ
jgi:hypothetical protein